MVMPAAARVVNGGLTIISRVRPVPKGYAILLYHRLHEDDSVDAPFLSIGATVFSSQMEWLKERAAVVTLSELVSMVKARKNPDKLYAALTFDDGYQDVLRVGLPLFRRHSVPVTFFISTSFIDDHSRMSWWDTLQGAGIGARQISRASEKIKYSGLPVEDALVGRGPSLGSSAHNGFASWDELRAAAGSGYVEVGGHTVTHPVLSRGGLYEVRECKARLEDELGKRTRFFAYPFGGVRDVSARAAECVRSAGFEAAVTTFGGFNKPGDDAFLLRRIKFMGHGLGDFAVSVSTGDIKRHINRAYAALTALRGPGLGSGKKTEDGR